MRRSDNTHLKSRVRLVSLISCSPALVWERVTALMTRSNRSVHPCLLSPHRPTWPLTEVCRRYEPAGERMSNQLLQTMLSNPGRAQWAADVCDLCEKASRCDASTALEWSAASCVARGLLHNTLKRVRAEKSSRPIPHSFLT